MPFMPSFSRFRRRTLRSRRNRIIASNSNAYSYSPNVSSSTSSSSSSSSNTNNRGRNAPYYIYPGLCRMPGRRAVTIDHNCPVSVYGAEDGRVDNLPSITTSSTSPTSNQQQDTCAICLEAFIHRRDMIRKLPCSHFFHSECIITWFQSADRCPLCNTSPLLRPKSMPVPPTPIVIDIDLKMDAPKYLRYSTSRQSSTCTNTSTDINQDSTTTRHNQNQIQPRVYSFVEYDRARYVKHTF